MEATTDTTQTPAATSANPESVRSLAGEVADTLRRSGAEPWLLRQSLHDPVAFLASQTQLVECRVQSLPTGNLRTYHRTAEYEAKREAQLAPAIARRDALRALAVQPQSKPTPPPTPTPAPPPTALSADLLADALELVESGDSAGLRMLANRAGRSMADVARLAREFGAKQPHFDGVRVALLERAWAALNAGDRDELTRLGNRTGKGWDGLHSAVSSWRRSMA